MALVEAMLKIRNRNLPADTLLAPQFLIDCDSTSSACEGGWPASALRYLKSIGNGNVAPRATDYPYLTQRMSCNRVVPMTSLNITKVTEKYPNGNEASLQVQVTNFGPTVVAMYATNNLAAYKSGVFVDSACPTGPTACSVVNHAVVVVGFGTDPVDGDYWKVKNSWGTTWGEDGYFRIARNKGNTCNIACWAINAY
jgi:C1A family cysteine protease